jgi:hypothetical protein
VEINTLLNLTASVIHNGSLREDSSGSFDREVSASASISIWTSLLIANSVFCFLVTSVDLEVTSLVSCNGLPEINELESLFFDILTSCWDPVDNSECNVKSLGSKRSKQKKYIYTNHPLLYLHLVLKILQQNPADQSRILSCLDSRRSWIWVSCSYVHRLNFFKNVTKMPFGITPG